MVLVHMTEEKFRAKAAELTEKQGITLPGPVGKISKDGVTAGYTHSGNTLTVHILDKPIFVSRAYCERRLEDWLTAGNEQGSLPDEPATQTESLY